MAAHRLVSFVLHQQKLPVGGSNAQLRIGDFLRRIGKRQLAEKPAASAPAAKARRQLLGRIGEHAGVVFFRFVDRPTQISRFVDRVSIGKQQPLSARPLRRRPAGIGLARPALFKLAGTRGP
jgi:hypothetical protein